MKVLIVSDTHRRNGNLQEVIERTAPFDMLIHLGDAEGSEDLITAWCMEQNQDCQVIWFWATTTFSPALDREKEIAIGPHPGISDPWPFLQRVCGNGAPGRGGRIPRCGYRHVWTHS